MVNGIPPAPLGIGSKGVSLFAPLSPEKAKQAEETRRVLNETLAAMKNSKNDINQQRKAMAAQKIARIKESLKMLRQMMAAADPKATARIAARLARELASAIKEYAAAGATFTEIGSASADAAAPSPSGASSETPPEGSAEPQEAEEQVKEQATDPFNAYRQTQENWGRQEKDRDNKGSTRKKDDDSPFIRDAAEIMNELRALIKNLRSRGGKRNHLQKDDISKAEAAIEDVTRAFRQLGNALAVGSVLA